MEKRAPVAQERAAVLGIELGQRRALARRDWFCMDDPSSSETTHHAQLLEK